jgi:hypothetical protein
MGKIINQRISLDERFPQNITKSLLGEFYLYPIRFSLYFTAVRSVMPTLWQNEVCSIVTNCEGEGG